MHVAHRIWVRMQGKRSPSGGTDWHTHTLKLSADRTVEYDHLSAVDALAQTRIIAHVASPDTLPLD